MLAQLGRWMLWLGCVVEKVGDIGEQQVNNDRFKRQLFKSLDCRDFKLSNCRIVGCKLPISTAPRNKKLQLEFYISNCELQT